MIKKNSIKVKLGKEEIKILEEARKLIMNITNEMNKDDCRFLRCAGAVPNDINSDFNIPELYSIAKKLKYLSAIIEFYD